MGRQASKERYRLWPKEATMRWKDAKSMGTIEETGSFMMKALACKEKIESLVCRSVIDRIQIKREWYLDQVE